MGVFRGFESESLERGGFGRAEGADEVEGGSVEVDGVAAHGGG